MIRAYWWRILLCTVCGLLLGLIVAMITPKQYDAIVQVMLDTKQFVPARAMTSADESVADLVEFGRARSVETQVELLQSFGIVATAAQRVADRLNLSTGPNSEINPVNLQNRVSVTATTESDIVTVRVRLSSPEIAQTVADEIYRAFDEKNTVNSQRGAERAIRLLEAQLEDITAQMSQADKDVAALQAKLQVANPEQQGTAIVQGIRELEQARAAVASQYEGSKARVSQIQAELRRTPPRILNSEVSSINPQLQRLEADLTTALVGRQGLLERYMEDHEQVQQLDAQIAALRAEIRKQKSRISAERQTIVNPIHSGLQNELVATRAGIDDFRQRLAEYDRELAAQRAALVEMPQKTLQMQEAVRRQFVLERNYTTYMDRLETLRASQTGRMAIPGLITEAVAFPRPTSPNMQLNLTLGAFLGLALGLLWSISTESKRSPIRTIGQLNRLSLQPVFRQIPELRRPVRGLDAPPAEVFDALLVNFVRSNKKGYRLGVLGIVGGTGATVTSINLAIAAMRGGFDVLLVENDPTRPIERRMGKTAEKAEDGSWQMSEKIQVIQNITEPGLATQALTLPPNIVSAGEGKDLVILDFLPGTVSSEAVLYAADLDEVILIVHAGITRTVDFLQVQQALVEAGCQNVTIAFARNRDVSEDLPYLEQRNDLGA